MATPIELAYLAGFLDGEGSISIGRHRKTKPNRKPQYRLHVLIVNTHHETLKSIQRVFGGNFMIRTSLPAHIKPQGYLRWSGVWAVQLLRAILPYVRTKLRHTELAIQFWEAKEAAKLDTGGSVPTGQSEQYRRQMIALNGDVHKRLQEA